jgi:hypothetical protein
MVAGLLPFVLTSLVAGALLGLLARGRFARLLGVLGYAVLAGLGAATVLCSWLGVLPGNWPAVAAVTGVLAVAIAGAAAGLAAVLGEAGVALAVLVVFLVGNPISGLTTAPELVPTPWGTLGQYLPVGAGGTLLRSVAYFDGHGATRAAVVLGCWALAGLALALARAARAPRRPVAAGAVRTEPAVARAVG